MKFSIVAKEDSQSEQLKERLTGLLKDRKLSEDPFEPDIIISIGGDGTLLAAFHAFRNRLEQSAFVGVHTGHLGFYADWMPEEIEKLADCIAYSGYTAVEYPLVEVLLRYGGNPEDVRLLALNEATVMSEEGTFVMDVEINGELFERFRGDGLCISTPSGSTAYNKALGGAIIHPSLASIQVAEMASINNRVFRTIGSPLILPSHHVLQLRPVTRKNFKVSVDHLSFREQNVESIRFRVADQKIRFARYKPFPFWNRVRASFIQE
jgi:ATP-NAD kinase.